MTFNPGDRVILTDDSALREDPFLVAVFGAPSKGMLGTVDEYTSEFAPEGALYVLFDELADNGAYGVLPGEIKLVESVEQAA